MTISNFWENPIFILYVLIAFLMIEIIVFFYGTYLFHILHLQKIFYATASKKMDGYLSSEDDFDFEKVRSIKNLFWKKDDIKFFKRIISFAEKYTKSHVELDKEYFRKILESEFQNLNRHIKSVINILPVIGLLGTFFGISIAVINLKFIGDLNEVYESIHSNLQSLKPFVNGLRLAFLTSLFGLFFSLCLKVYYEFIYSNVLNELNNFSNIIIAELSMIFETKDPYQKLNKAINSFSSKVGSLSSVIKQSLDSFLESYYSITKEQDQKFKNRIDELGDLNKTISSDLKNVSEKLSQNVDSQITITENFTKQLELSRDVIQKFDETSKEAREQNLKQAANLIAIGKALRKLEEDSDNLFKKLETFYEPLKNIGEKFDALLSTAKSLNDPVINLSNDLKEKYLSLTNTMTIHSNSFSELVISINGNIRQLNELYSKSSSDIIETHKNSETLLAQINNVEKQFNETIVKLSNYAHDLNTAGQLLVNDINEKVGNLFDNLSRKDNVAITLQKSDDQLFEQIKEFIEKLEIQYNQFNFGIDSFQKEIRVLSNSLKQIQRPWFLRIFRDEKNKKDVS